MTESFPDESAWPFEEELMQFKGESIGQLGDFLESTDWSTSLLINAGASAMDGTAGKTIHDMINTCYGARDALYGDMKLLSEHLVDTLDRDEAVRIWAQTIRANILRIQAAFVRIHPDILVEVPDIDDLHQRGLAYYEGTKQAIEDGIDLNDDPEEWEPIEGAHIENDRIVVDNIVDLFSDISDEIDTDDDEEDDHDEYGQWALHEYWGMLETAIDDLLEKCPPELYSK